MQPRTSLFECTQNPVIISDTHGSQGLHRTGDTMIIPGPRPTLKLKSETEGCFRNRRRRRKEAIKSFANLQYRDRLKSVLILLSRVQAGPGRKVKQEQEDISRNCVPSF